MEHLEIGEKPAKRQKTNQPAKHISLKEKLPIITLCEAHEDKSLRAKTKLVNVLLNRSLGKSTLSKILEKKDCILLSAKKVESFEIVREAYVDAYR